MNRPNRLKVLQETTTEKYGNSDPLRYMGLGLTAGFSPRGMK
jgi:hypothetical protein